MKRICINCQIPKFRIKDDFNFCPECGSKLEILRLSWRAYSDDIDYTNEFTETLLEEVHNIGIHQMDAEENPILIEDVVGYELSS